MAEWLGGNLEAHFGDMTDPRVDRTKRHKLFDIIAIAICGVICGADSWTEIEEFGLVRQAWLKGFLELPNGIPSHDTFGRVFARLEAKEFHRRFSEWVRSVATLTGGQVVAIDGKTMRRSHDRTNGQDALHLVSAWASQSRLSLGQLNVEESNEITAIPRLLDLLYLAGCIVTVDAIGCQKEIAQAIRNAKGEYVLRVKANQGHLYEDLEEWFAYAHQTGFAAMTHSQARTVNKGHGRLEIRECWVVTDRQAFDYIRHYEGWVDLQSIVQVVRQRRVGDQVTTETAYYISSLGNDARQLLACTRSHWSVENSLHWVLDVVFREDQARHRTGYSAENFGLLRKVALNLIQQDKSVKGGVKSKRLRAALDPDYLLHLLSQ